MRIAVLADVHGNRLALEAVLAHLRAASPDLIVNLGDLVSGPYDPQGAAALQRSLGAQTLAGNHERAVLGEGLWAPDVLARALLQPAERAWLAGLPPRLSLLGGEIFACHGSPAGGDLEYLLEDASTGRMRLDTLASIRPRLAGIGAARLVLCGHTHVPRVASVDGVLVVNPGSVGMPCYRDPAPVPHVMEAGAPFARYALLDRGPHGWAAALQAVPYDWEGAARQAEAHGLADYAAFTRSGWLQS